MDEYDDDTDGDGSVPECRICGDELTNSSELLDDTCTRCFQKARYGRVLTAAEMTEAAR